MSRRSWGKDFEPNKPSTWPPEIDQTDQSTWPQALWDMLAEISSQEQKGGKKGGKGKKDKTDNITNRR